MAPALQSTRPHVASTLKEEGAGGGRPAKLTLRNALIGLQVATSTLLLVGAGLFLRSLQERLAVDPGFGHDPAALVTVQVPATRFDEQQGRQYIDRLVERFEQMPGVVDLGLISNLHLGPNNNSEAFNVDGVERPADREGHPADHAIVDAGFFAAAGVRIVKGRNFSEHDRPDSPRVAIISEALAERFFPGTDPTGKFLRKEHQADLLIVGVASDTNVRTLGEDPRSFFYEAYSQEYAGFLTIVARTSRDSNALVTGLLATAKEYDPEFWAFATTTMERHIGAQALPAQLSALLLSAFAFIGIALAAIGLYGIVSYSVSQRTREIGIRLSLGADTGSIVSMLMVEGLRPVLIGSAAGLLLSALVSRVVAGLLYGVSTFDPLAFLGTTAVLTLTAMAATWLPARRVSRVSPVSALRFE